MIIIIGAITFPLPIPLGLVLMAIGIAMLIGTSKLARVMMKILRRRHVKFDLIMRKAQTLAPGFISKLLQRTDPNKKSSPSSYKT